MSGFEPNSTETGSWLGPRFVGGGNDSVMTNLQRNNKSIVTSLEMNLTDDGIPIHDFSNDPLKTAMNTAIKWLSVCIVTEVMLGLGCTVDLDVLKEHVKRPIGVGIAGLSQFVFMPLLVFGVIKSINVARVPAIVMLVTASIPGGTLSNILAYLVEGDMALSMLMTTCSSVLALAFVPFNLFVYGSHWLPEDTDYRHLIPYHSVVLSLILMMVPVSVGVLLNWKAPAVAKKVVLACKGMLVLTIISLAVLSGILYEDTLLRYLPTELWILCVFMPLVGFAFGFCLSTLARLSDSTRRTVAVETMCQNGNLGCAILKVAFPSHLIGSFFVFPLLYSVFQLLEGMILVAILRLKKKHEDQVEEEKNKEFFALGRRPVRELRRVSLYVIDKMRRRLSTHRADDKEPVVSDVTEEKSDVTSFSRDDVTDLPIEEQSEHSSAADIATSDMDVIDITDDVTKTEEVEAKSD